MAKDQEGSVQEDMLLQKRMIYLVDWALEDANLLEMHIAVLVVEGVQDLLTGDDTAAQVGVEEQFLLVAEW